jgi:hypothetical protein
MPKLLLKYFSMNNTIPLAMAYNLPNTFKEATHYWSSAILASMIGGKDKSDFCFGRKKQDCYKPLRRYAAHLRNKVGLVVGCDYPWAESLLIRLNVTRLVTMERVPTGLEHDSMKAYTPSEVSALYVQRQIEPFDFAFSYGAVEHEGLGNRGEGLNPDGDFELMDKMFCMLKPGGILFLAVPIGPDFLHWNTYRTYGKLRLPLLLSGWDLLDVLGNFTSVHAVETKKATHKQPLLVLQKPLMALH